MEARRTVIWLVGASKARAYQTTSWAKTPWLAAAMDFTFEMTVDELVGALAHVTGSVFQRAHRKMHFKCTCQVSQPDVNRLLRWNLSTRLWWVNTV